jgi:uridylate kinase
MDSGIGVSIVVGGGNVIRGRNLRNHEVIRQETADSMGMLATTINGVLLREILSCIGVESELVSNLRLPFDIGPSDSFTISKILAQGKVVIFVGGTGLPYFTTDTLAVVGAFLSDCDLILKATTTDGIYDKDPRYHTDARHIPEITYREALEKNLGIMDGTAFSLAAQRNIPVYVFSIMEPNCFLSAINRRIKMSIAK